MTGWQPIESLPSEGVVLAYFPSEREVRRFSTMQVRDGKPWVVGSIFAFDLTRPTHWMPLPPAPDRLQGEDVGV